MKKILVVEPVVAIYMFATFLSAPLVQQYVYRRLWEESANTSFVENSNVSYCTRNQTDPDYLKQKEVQRKASLFSMKIDLSGSLLSILVAFVLVSNGDRRGRKISVVLPLVGSFLTCTFLSLTAYYSLPLSLLFVSAFVGGVFGSTATFLGGAFTFVIDLCKTEKQKTVRIAAIDLICGLASGFGGLASGYILKGTGFMWTFATLSLLHLINIFYCTCCLGDTVQVSELEPRSLREGLKETFSGVYLLFKSSSPRKRTSIILMLCMFMVYLFTLFGGLSLFTLYELKAPLCWDAIYIGYGSAASTLVSLTSFLGVVLLSQYLRDIYLIFIGISSYIGGIIMTAFANTTLLMFLVRIPFFLCFMPIPVLRTMLSKAVLPTEQGAVFACIACLEVITGTAAIAVFSGVYAETVAWYPGFTFLLSAGICIVPLTFLWITAAYMKSGERLLRTEVHSNSVEGRGSPPTEKSMALTPSAIPDNNNWLTCAAWHEDDFVHLVNDEDSVGESADSSTEDSPNG